MLTKKQHELLIFINKWLENHGVSPSFDEMKEALGLKSKSGIHRLITGLEEREFIRRLPHRARALEVLRLPDDVSISPGQKRHNSVALEPANEDYETRIFGPDQVEVQGKLAGLIRHY